MATVTKRETAAGVRYDVRYRDPEGVQRKKTYTKKKHADDFASSVEADKLRGTYIDPNAGKVLFESYARDWLEMQTFNESSRTAVKLRLQNHVFPVLGKKQLRQIRPSTVQAWIRGMDALAASYRQVIFSHVSAVLSAAVDDEMIVRNPCKASSVKRPTREDRKVEPWPGEWVAGVREALPARYRIVVTLGAGLGLRQGEILGLSPDDVDFLRGFVQVRRQVKRLSDGSLIFAPPKGEKDRQVPLPGVVRDALAASLSAFPAVPVTMPWRGAGGELMRVPLIVTNSTDKAFHAWRFNEIYWHRALLAAGVPADPRNGTHALRHYYASVLLDAGESILALSEYLGHSDPGFTLRTYTHLMPSSHERTRKAIDAALTASAIDVPSLRVEGSNR